MEIIEEPVFAPLARTDWAGIIDLGLETFIDHADADLIRSLMLRADPRISRKVTFQNRLVGFYLLNPRSILSVPNILSVALEDLGKYTHKRGVEGIALVILPWYRGSGIGERLKDVPRSLGFDYVWGFQAKSLKNLPQWLKRRRLVAETEDVWITLEDLR